MAINISPADIQNFMESKEGRFVLGWLVGKNDKQIKAYLAKQAELIKAGDVTTKGAIKSIGWKTLALFAALYVARQEGTRAWKEATKMWNKNDITGFEKLGRAALELWPPTMTIRSFKSAWDWLTKKSNSNKAKQQSPEMMKAREQSEKALYGISDEQLADKSARARSMTDELAKQLGMQKRPSNQTAQTEWAKEVERMSKIKKNERPAGSNAPTWYWQGLADKLMSTVLTWTSLKQYNADYRFVSNCAIRVGLTLPVQKNVLHTQVKSNINILWQALRGKNTGAFNYTEGDVFAYQFGISALIARHRYLVKLLSLGNKYDPEVTVQPDCLYDSIFTTRGRAIRLEVATNKPSYCERLNTIAKSLNTYALKGNTLISRWNYLADKCISDYNGPKAVKAVYKIEMFPELNMNFDGSTDTRELKYSSIDYGTATINSLITDLENAVDNIRLWNNSVLLKVAGDMIKLLGATSETFANTFYVNGTEIPEFKFDAEANDQLRNGKMFEPAFSDVTKFIAPGYYAGNEALGANVGFVSSSHGADFGNWSYIKPEWLVTSDRNKVFNNAENLQLIQFANVQVKSSAGVVQGTAVFCEEHGTSILHGFTITGYDATNNPSSQEIKSIITFDSTCDLQYNGQGINLTVNQFNMLLQIDFIPSPEQVSMNGTNLNWYGRWLDVDDYAFMTELQYKQMNNVASYSQTFFFNPEQVKIIGILS